MVVVAEKVILTPVAKGEDWTILQLERKRTEPETLDGAFVAGGAHKGLVVNRQLSNGELREECIQWDICLKCGAMCD